MAGASIQFTFGFSTSTNSPIAKMFHWYVTFFETRDHRVARTADLVDAHHVH